MPGVIFAPLFLSLDIIGRFKIFYLFRDPDRFSITIIFVCMFSLRCKKNKYHFFHYMILYKFQFSKDVHFMVTIFNFI